MPDYEIYALKSAGPFTRNEAMVLWMRDWEKNWEINYYFWLLMGPDGPVLLDAGVEPGLAAERGLPGYVSPAQLLSSMGIDAAEVKHVVLSHLHWDHMNGLVMFPNAAFYVQRLEYEFWVENPLARRGPFAAVSVQESLQQLAALKGSRRLILLEGDAKILPGLKCLLAPGHTPGLQALAAETPAGPAVLGSDCGHVFQNYADEWPSCIICDLPAWLKSFEKLKAAAARPDLLFPGHDATMSSGYPQVRPGVTRLV
jgi:glyoxylase-like metal-dependent hydrolase (beta-lactamase superfamily II)